MAGQDDGCQRSKGGRYKDYSLSYTNIYNVKLSPSVGGVRKTSKCHYILLVEFKPAETEYALGEMGEIVLSKVGRWHRIQINP